MRNTALVTVLAGTFALALAACGESATNPPEVGPPLFTVIGGDNPKGAIVLNKGKASDGFTGTCNFGPFVTNDVTAVRNPSGGGLLSCHWKNFGFPTKKAIVIHGFECSLFFFGVSLTTKSHFTLSPSDVANLHCTFDEVLF